MDSRRSSHRNNPHPLPDKSAIILLTRRNPVNFGERPFGDPLALSNHAKSLGTSPAPEPENSRLSGVTPEDLFVAAARRVCQPNGITP